MERLYVRGTENKCKEFTIDFTWKHSAAGSIGSVTVNDENGLITLNLNVKEDRIEDVKYWATKFGLEVMAW